MAVHSRASQFCVSAVLKTADEAARVQEPSLLISRAALVCKAWLEVAISETAWSRRFLSPAGHVLSSESPAGRALPPKLALALLRHCTATYPWPLLWAKLMQPCNLLQGLGSMPMGRLSPLRSTGETCTCMLAPCAFRPNVTHLSTDTFLQGLGS